MHKHTHFLFCAVLASVVACGSSTPSATLGQSEADQQLIGTYSASSKAAVQATSDVQEQSDLSETATSGEDDDGGTGTPRAMARPGFDMHLQGQTDFNDLRGDFNNDLQFHGGRSGQGALMGNCHAGVRHIGDGNLALVLTYDVTRTLDNNDVIHIATEPNVAVSKLGTRASGKVTRSINGTVHRTLVSASDSNRDFDLSINHNTVVVDSYTGNVLQTRTLNGQAQVTDNKRKTTSVVTFADVSRGKPRACLCPTSGSITQVLTQGEQTQTHTYTFSGTCGSSSVSVDGQASVTVSTTAAAKTDADAAAADHASSGRAGANAHIHASGALAWEHCVPGT